MPDQQQQVHANPAPSSFATSVGAGAAAGAALGGLGGLAQPQLHPLSGLATPWAGHAGAQAPASSNKAETQAAKVAAIAKASGGAASSVAPALHAAARGETVAQQAQQLSGPVKMKASDALQIAAQMNPQQQWAGANPQNSQATYRSPFVSVGLSGITNNQQDAEYLSQVVTGDLHPHGYAVYGSNTDLYAPKGSPDALNSSDPKKGTVDQVNDIAAVTQYAAAADLGIKITPDSAGTGKQVKIDWGALRQMDITADMTGLGGKIKYDNPEQLAQNGYKSVLADMDKNGKKPGDKGQFISLTGHSGGGQSSFYTALKLASEGYTNVSLVGVDMAMTPHEREVLQTLGVKVTNITSNAKSAIGTVNSPVGDGIRAGMGGGQNYYDLNVARQDNGSSPHGVGDLAKDLDPVKLHSATNDPNVVTTLRFAQYLDSIGQHGNYSDKEYQQFLKDTGGKGNQVHFGTDPQGQAHPDGTADPNLFAPGSGKVTDQRGLPGPAANSTRFGGGASPIETAVNVLGGKPVTQAIQDGGQAIHNGLDNAGHAASSWLSGMWSKAGNFVGGVAHKGMDLMGQGMSAAGNLVNNGLDRAGGMYQAVTSKVASAENALGTMANNGLHAVSSGLSTAGNVVSNGFNQAGDTAKSLLGHVPLLGGWMGNVADKGMHLLGSGASATSNLLGNGVNAVGDATQSGMSLLAKGTNAAGGLVHSGLDVAGNGVQALGNAANTGMDKLGGMAETAISRSYAATGNVLGNAVYGGLDTLGQGVSGVANVGGQVAGFGTRLAFSPLVGLLHHFGVDSSQIAGLDNEQWGNHSRTWKNLRPSAPGDIQTVPAAPTTSASPPANANYAN